MLNERLRDKLVSSVNDDGMVQRLLMKGDKRTFDEACKLRLQMEQNKEDCRELLKDGKINQIG